MPRGRKTSLVIQLTPDERSLLEYRQRSTGIPAGLARRSRIILMLADGYSISDVSRTVGIRRRFVYKWAYRYLEEGADGLADRPGQGNFSSQTSPQDPSRTV